jgi:hypothetical protein
VISRGGILFLRLVATTARFGVALIVSVPYASAQEAYSSCRIRPIQNLTLAVELNRNPIMTRSMKSTCSSERQVDASTSRAPTGNRPQGNLPANHLLTPPRFGDTIASQAGTPFTYQESHTRTAVGGVDMPAGMSLSCRYTAGPKSGQTQSFLGIPGFRPVPLGSPCTDGQLSSGISVR